jgi:hypothetical protein
MTYPARPVPPAPRVWPWWVAPALLIGATMLNVGCLQHPERGSSRYKSDRMDCYDVLVARDSAITIAEANRACDNAEGRR